MFVVEYLLLDCVLECLDVAGCAVYVDERHAKLWEHVVMTIDVAEGEPDGFSLLAGPGRHFTSTPSAPPTGRRSLDRHLSPPNARS